MTEEIGKDHFISMKNLLMASLVVLVCCLNAMAYLSELKILTKQEIVKLSDEKILEAYIDALVELTASETFHTTSGFTPKEYENYKEMLRYKILLLQEIDKRKLDVPRVDASQ